MFRVEFGRLGRNIWQHLLCGFYPKKGTSEVIVDTPEISISQFGKIYGVCEIENRIGQWEVGPIQLP